MIRVLEDNLEADTFPDELAPVRCALRYLSNRLEQVDYPRALANDLPIGSGLIESGHRHVLQATSGASLQQPMGRILACPKSRINSHHL